VGDADEHAGAGDVVGLESHGTGFEGRQRRLDLAEPLVDLVGQLVGASYSASSFWYSALSASIVACSSAVRSSGVPELAQAALAS
jgi:hypothetical protein